jgi:hypothetical protein
MKAGISLKELVSLMNSQSNSLYYSFSLERMVFVESNLDELSTDKPLSNEDISSFQIQSSPLLISIPSKTEINEFAIMKQFAHQLYNQEITKEILSVMHGSGVFKRFNEIVSKRDLKDDWLKFKTQSLKKQAIEWCQKNGFSYNDDLRLE